MESRENILNTLVTIIHSKIEPIFESLSQKAKNNDEIKEKILLSKFIKIAPEHETQVYVINYSFSVKRPIDDYGVNLELIIQKLPFEDLTEERKKLALMENKLYLSCGVYFDDNESIITLLDDTDMFDVNNVSDSGFYYNWEDKVSNVVEFYKANFEAIIEEIIKVANHYFIS